jgi:hypothetical protein
MRASVTIRMPAARPNSRMSAVMYQEADVTLVSLQKPTTKA